MALAIAALHRLSEGTENVDRGGQPAVLVVAGGYDPRVAENVEYLEVS